MAIYPQCTKCQHTYCSKMPLEGINKNLLPDFCPMKTNEETTKSVIDRYGEDGVKKIYVPATITEKEAYEFIRGALMAVRPGIKELIEFGKLVHAEKMGVAFCAGLQDEAARIVSILESAGFAVASVRCKCGGIDKTKLNVAKEYKIGDPLKFEAACNPILQARLLNDAETDINVIVGLCVGHDMLFTMNSKAPVTTLIALYSNYHKDIIKSQRTL